MKEQFEKLKKAQIGQSVYVTVTGREYYPGVILGYGYFDYYPNKMSYEVMVSRKDTHRFVEYFDIVYAKVKDKQKGLGCTQQRQQLERLPG